MGGIVGMWGWGDAEALRGMSARLAHRGPVGGEWDRVLPDGVALGLGGRSSSAGLPMGSDDGMVWISWDGALYNAPDLRADLESKGHSFRTRSDAEVVLRLVHESGSDAISRFDGAFALVAIDLRAEPPNAPPGRGPLLLWRAIVSG